VPLGERFGQGPSCVVVINYSLAVYQSAKRNRRVEDGLGGGIENEKKALNQIRTTKAQLGVFRI